MKLAILTLAFAFVTINLCYSQQDTEFWFVAPEVSSEHGDAPINLRISTIQETFVRISIPTNRDFEPITRTIPANTTISIDLTYALDLLENRPADEVLNKGLLITSSSPITAYYEVSNSQNPEIFPLKGKNALGTSFLIPGQDLFNNQFGNATVEVVATEDNTEITISLTSAVVGHNAGEIFSITLNRGQTYSLRATTNLAQFGLGGTQINSTKPIAVTITDDSIRNGGSFDLVGDQLVPINQIGTNYIIVRGYADAEVAYIWATEDGTTVTVNGITNPESINVGEYVRVNLTEESLFINTDKPAYVYQLTGHGGEIGDAILPQIDCTGSGQVGFVRTSSLSFSLMLLTRNGNQDGFVLDGNLLDVSSQFSVVPGTNNEWVAAIIDFSTEELTVASHLLENTEGFFHMGILHQLGASSVFGYFSNYNSFEQAKAIRICSGETAIVDPGPNFDSYKWSNGSTERFITVNQEGTFTVELTFEGCSEMDTFNVFFEPTSVSLGEDRLICDDETIVLDPGRYDTYTWRKEGSNDILSKNDRLLVSDSGTYFLEVSNKCGIYFDTIKIAETTRPEFSLPQDILVCDNDVVTIESTNGFDSYFWNTGEVSQEISVRESGTYTLQVIEGGCTLIDSIEVQFEEAPTFLSIGEDRNICAGEEIVLEVEGERLDYFRWSNDSTTNEITISGEGTYTVTAGNVCGELSASVTLSTISTSDLFFSNAFSPNNDGINDTFELDGWLTGSRLKVFNRWGELVFESDAYDNEWGGENIDKGLYYYEIRSECLLETYTGWLKIVQ